MARAFLLSTIFLMFPALSFALPEVIEGRYVIERQKNPSAVSVQSNHYEIVQPGEVIDEVVLRRSGNALPALISQNKIVPYDAERAARDCDEIKMDASVKICEPNFIGYNTETVPDDPYYNFQYSLKHPSYDGTTVFDTRAGLAWDMTKGSSDIVVAVIDSGISLAHEDIAQNLWQNPGEIAGDGVDNDGNGIIDDLSGFDAQNLNNTTSDCNGHGSHVSGIIGAKGNNSLGISGVAWDVKLMIVKNAVNCGNSVSYAAVARGIDYVIGMKKRGVNVVAVNASFGGGGFSQILFDAIDRLKAVNIVFVAAAGNNGTNNEDQPFWPSSFGLDNIIAVANVDNISNPNKLASNSNFGANVVDIGAPGVSILSLLNDANNYVYKSGTSMATPMVVGGIVLLKALKPQFNTYSLVVDRILNTGTPIDFLNGKTKTGSMLNLQTLLTAAEPVDQCPDDVLKLAPGTCGCGTADVYSDADSDLSFDCVDACDNDALKIVPGVCGCGIAETDSDNDGKADCEDSCPLDASKLSPGIRGCGLSDQDDNSNSSADCLDAQISSVVPNAPKVSIDKKKRKIVITLEESKVNGTQLVLKIVSKKKSGKKMITKTSYKKNTKKVSKIPIPAVGTQLIFTYTYEIPGPSVFSSIESVPKSVKIK